MKSNRGVTLTSLIIYIIGLVAIVAIISNFTGYFYKNVTDVATKQSAEEQHSKLLSYITKDVNSNDLEYVQTNVSGLDCIIFKFNGGKEHQYIYSEQKIYYININENSQSKILMCENIYPPSGSKIFQYDGSTLNMNLTISNINFSNILNLKI